MNYEILISIKSLKQERTLYTLKPGLLSRIKIYQLNFRIFFSNQTATFFKEFKIKPNLLFFFYK